MKSASGAWYEMNDDLVEKIKGAPVNMKNAYILFYIREKGQGLEAAVNSTKSSHTHQRKTSLPNGSAPKKRRVIMSDEEGEEDNGEHLSQAGGMSSIHSAVEENDGDIASDGERTAECVSVTH